jgi:hypothetical protein
MPGHTPCGRASPSSLGERSLDRRRISLQIRATLVPFLVEQRRPDSTVMKAVRVRARKLLGDLDEAVRPYPDLKEELAQARRQIEADEP